MKFRKPRKSAESGTGKYGEGVVVGETEETLTVRFEGYGEKELMKAFSGLEEI